MPDMGLKDKVAIVTGAGSRADGIGNGRAASILLAREGAKVVLLDATPEWADVTKKMIDAEGGTSMVVSADVTDAASCADAVKAAVDAWGRVDVLVNNVGIGGPPGNAVEVDPVAWDAAMRVNVTSMMLMAKYAIPEMRKVGGGSIVNIASLAAVYGLPFALHYTTSKAAVIGLTRGLARELGRDNIRVNCLAPSAVLTEGTREFFGEKHDRALQVIAGNQAIQRNLQPSDVAGAMLFLASAQSGFVTGQTIMVDGGTAML
jgi:NAD(P)-dependent dehydrogenase (short-subunit alcohol dehydrogenase family)